jgi:hypothetical protein
MGAGRARTGLLLVLAVSAGLLAGCGTPAASGPTADPSASRAPSPDYLRSCAPTGLDSSSPCIGLALEAIDRARAAEGVGPMRLPADFGQLSPAEQVFVAVDRERVDRGLAPFRTLSADLSASDARAASRGQLPPTPDSPYLDADTEWFGGLANGLDVDYEWMYQDGPGSGIPNCSGTDQRGCWTDRHIVLDRFGTPAIVLGAAVDPTGDRSPDDRGGPSLAATFAVDRSVPGPALLTWSQVVQASAASTLRPLARRPADEAPTGIADPVDNVDPVPDYTLTCAPAGVDSSAACVSAVLAALDRARALEGVGPMVLPADFAQLSVPEQLFVAVDRERVDRGLAPFVGLVTGLDANAQVGADRANDPPDAGPGYLLTDGEWAGGSSNGLDAVYGWMYDDGPNSGNLDCLHPRAAGCWGHRQGILDDFGAGPDLVMGAAIDPTGDTYPGDRHGTSMAATLATAARPPTAFVYTWAQALAAMPPGAG